MRSLCHSVILRSWTGITLGNNLADYVDGGGIVVQHGFSHLGPGEPYGINGRWVSGNYNPYDYSENFAFNSHSHSVPSMGATHSWRVSPASTATSRTL